jgi:hypothetical protein
MTPDTLASAGAGEPGAASGKDTPMWAATVTNKQIDKRGNLVVTVEFTDGVKTITEDFATSQEQPSGWLEEQVGRKLKALDGIAATVVPEVGAVIAKPVDPTPEPSGDAQRDAYAADIARYNQYLSAVRLGIAIDKEQDFIDLKDRLRTNFRPDYLDLF